MQRHFHSASLPQKLHNNSSMTTGFFELPNRNIWVTPRFELISIKLLLILDKRLNNDSNQGNFSCDFFVSGNLYEKLQNLDFEDS